MLTGYWLFLLIAPEEPIEGYLGGEDGEDEGEGAFAQVVEPGGVDDERGGDGERGEDEEERDAEDSGPRKPQSEPSRLISSALSIRRPRRHFQSCFFAVFSEEVPDSLPLLSDEALSEEPESPLPEDSDFSLFSDFSIFSERLPFL